MEFCFISKLQAWFFQLLACTPILESPMLALSKLKFLRIIKTNIYQTIRDQRILHNTLLWLYSLYHHAKAKHFYNEMAYQLHMLPCKTRSSTHTMSWCCTVVSLKTTSETTKPTQAHWLPFSFIISKNCFQPGRFTNRKILQLLKWTYSDKTYGVLPQFLPHTNNINVDLLSLFKRFI